jgi:IclR family transcriptional regulator, acetate operon repressor
MGVHNSGVQSVERALDLLEKLADAGREMGVSELGKATGLPYATIHRLAATLLHRGYLHQDARSRKYVLGSRLIHLGSAAGHMMSAAARPYLERLVELTGETANLALLEEGYVVYVAQAPSRRMVRTFTEVGNRVPPHSTAVGKVLLSHQPASVLSRIVSRHGLAAATRNTITDPSALLEEVAKVGTRGYALDLEEQEEGVTCVAVPLVVSTGPVAAISVSGPTARMGEGRRDEIVGHLQAVAAEFASGLDAASGEDGPEAEDAPDEA